MARSTKALAAKDALIAVLIPNITVNRGAVDTLCEVLMDFVEQGDKIDTNITNVGPLITAIKNKVGA